MTKKLTKKNKPDNSRNIDELIERLKAEGWMTTCCDKTKKAEPEKFNYCIGHYWENGTGAVGTYAYGNEVFFGPMKEAKQMLKYVKRQSPDNEWKIFKLVEA